MRKDAMKEFPSFNPVQQKAVDLMKSDLRFIYTMTNNHQQLSECNYVVSSMPYIGLIIDGIEDWINRYNNSSKSKLSLPVFSEEEKKYYEELRSSIKIWEPPYDDIYKRIQALYIKSDEHFSGLCIPLAKKLRLYDIYGADIVDGEICGNTILCSYYLPSFSFSKEYGKYMRKMSIIGGQYIQLFGAIEPYQVKTNMQFSTKDYGGFIKSPVGNRFSDKFILFSVLCQIQFVLICVEKYIDEECPTKLRFEYILYYYLIGVLPAINDRLKTSFTMDSKHYSDLFRNAMAHYGLGVALRQEELIEADPFGGLTQKHFNCDYYSLKKYVVEQLYGLSIQIKQYLKI